MSIIKCLYFYLIGVNIIAFLLYESDKRRAQRHAWRIPEKTLLGVAALGGSVGALAAMSIFHHKTRKPKFYVGIPLILVAEAVAAVLVWYTGIR